MRGARRLTRHLRPRRSLFTQPRVKLAPRWCRQPPLPSIAVSRSAPGAPTRFASYIAADTSIPLAPSSTSPIFHSDSDKQILAQLYRSGELKCPPETVLAVADRAHKLTRKQGDIHWRRWARIMRGRGRLDDQAAMGQTAREQQALDSYLAMLRADSTIMDDGALGTADQLDAKDVCAIANVIYQMAPTHSDVALFMWEWGVARGERNALFSLAQVVVGAGEAGAVEQSLIDLSAALYRRSSELGHPFSTYNLALMYLDGRAGGVEMEGKVAPDFDAALTLLEQAAEGGVQFALTNLANLYRLGLGTPVDTDKAVELYEKAAELGDPKATLALGNLYMAGVKDGEIWSLKPNASRAFQYWHRTAIQAQKPTDGVAVVDENGTSDSPPIDGAVASQALFNLGNCYFLGVGIDNDGSSDTDMRTAPNYSIALEFWDLAVKANPLNLRALLHAGNVHFDGLLGKKRPDYETAMYYYDRALAVGERMGALSELSSGSTANKGPLPIVPIAELTNPSADDELLSIVNAMRSICRDKLGMSNASQPLAATGPVATISTSPPKPDSLSELFATAAEITPSTIVNPFKAANNHQGKPDHEQTFLQGMKKRNFVLEAKSDAMHRRWRHVEEFGSQSEDKVKPSSAWSSVKETSSCTIM